MSMSIIIIRFDIGQQRTVEMEIDPAQRRPGDVWSSRNGPPRGYVAPTEPDNDLQHDQDRETGEADAAWLERRGHTDAYGLPL